MDEHLHHIEEAFHSGLNDFAERPQPGVWDHISARLDATAIAALQKKYTRTKRMAAVLLLLLLCCAVYLADILFTGRSSADFPSGVDFPSPELNQPKVPAIQMLKANTSPVIFSSAERKKAGHRVSVLADSQGGSLPSYFPGSHFSSATAIAKATPINISSAVCGTNSNILINRVLIAALPVDQSPGSEAARPAGKLLGIKTKYDRWSVIPFFSPDVPWYHLEDDQVVNQQSNASRVSEEETHEFSYTMGALVQYRLNRHWSLQSGLMLANTNILVDPTKIYAQADNSGSIKYRLNTSSGYGYIQPAFSGNPTIGDSLSTIFSIQSLRYLSVPSELVYRLPLGKWELQVSGGLSANILARARLVTTVENDQVKSVETIKRIEGLKNTYWSALAGAGVTYSIAPKVAFMLAPTLRIPLEPINKYTTVKTYPKTFGVVVGITVQFN
jgi:hypothetical protein